MKTVYNFLENIPKMEKTMKKYYTRWILVSFISMIIGISEGNEEAATQSKSASIPEKHIDERR